MLKRVIGRLSVTLSVKIITGKGKNSLTELLIKELSLSVIFLRLSVKTLYERDKNLRGPPILSEEARGHFSVLPILNPVTKSP